MKELNEYIPPKTFAALNLILNLNASKFASKCTEKKLRQCQTFEFLENNKYMEYQILPKRLG